MAEHNEIGEWGEERAREWLTKEGFVVAAKNERRGRNEVDIIAFRGNRIHFVEVKTRTRADDDPLHAVTPAKVRRICRFADSYIRTMGIPHDPQIDVIAITGSPAEGVISLDYYPDAFLPPLN